MHTSRTWALGLLAVAAVATASDVIQLKEDTFDDFIKSHDLVLAEFFAPWCGHCKALAPEYEEAATTLKEKDISLVKVDCTEEQKLCKQFDVEGYPTVLLFKGQQQHIPYKGARKAAAITSYMIKKSLPLVTIVTKDSLEDFKKTDKVVLVAYFGTEDKTANETFAAAATKLEDVFAFGASNDAALAEAEGVKAPAIVLYKDFDEGKAVFTEKFDVDAIEKFAKAVGTPLIGEIGPETYQEYMDAKIPLAYIFAETSEERVEFEKALKPIAESHRGVVNFATIDAKQYAAHAGNINLKTDKFPAFAIQDVEKNEKFPYDQDKDITHDSIKSFVADFVAGKIKPSVKSEPIPETQEGPVQVVVAHSFKDIVLDDTKDVLIEYYAPWCGHCKALAPKYEDLAQRYADSEFKDKIVIAKVDATANDVPDEIQGFPTIKLYPAGDKKNPVDFTGARTVEDLIKFIGASGKYKALLPLEEEEAKTPDTSAAAETEEAEKKDEKAEKNENEAEKKVEKDAEKHDEL